MFRWIPLCAGAALLAAAGTGEAPPEEWVDSWSGSTAAGEKPLFSRNVASKVEWVREVSVSMMVGCEMALRERSIAPFEIAEDRDGPYHRIAGTSLMLRKLLGGGTDRPPDGAKLFLVRAVFLHPLTGAFGVYFEDGNLLVEHGCLGNFRTPMKRSALIVALPAEPSSVTVRCRMAR